MKYRNLTSIVAISLMSPASADVIYSGYQNISIPTNFTGVSVTVGGGTINPFLGGVGVANDAAFQPVRTGTGGLDAILNLGTGTTVDASSVYSTGAGGSFTHVGGTGTIGGNTTVNTGAILAPGDAGVGKVGFSSVQYWNSTTGSLGTPTSQGTFTISGSSLTRTDVPAPPPARWRTSC